MSIPLFTILSWYTTEDIVEDIDESLDTLLLVKRFLPLTSSKFSGTGPGRGSIPVLFEGNMVGNVKVCKLDIVEKLKCEEENCLFAKFPIGTTMQDGGKRKEVTTVTCYVMLTLTLDL